MAGLRQLSALFKERTMHKYYLCLVEGEIHEKKVLEGYLKKDERTNKVRLVSEKTLASDYMKTAYEPLCVWRTDAFKGTFSYGTHTPNQASFGRRRTSDCR